jgi:hypothetical protein
MQVIVGTYYRPNADFSQHDQSGGFRMVDSRRLDREQECLKG